MSSHTASSSNGGNGSGDFGAPRRNSKRPKCDSLLYFSFFFFFSILGKFMSALLWSWC
jgi:hypothetical protein